MVKQICTTKNVYEQIFLSKNKGDTNMYLQPILKNNTYDLKMLDTHYRILRL